MGSVPPTAMAWGARYLVPMASKWINLFLSNSARPVTGAGHMTSPQGPDADSVALDVPGRPEYLRLVRLAAADCGTRADLSFEEVEDLRIAVDELSYALMGEDTTGGTMSLR